MRPEVVTGLLMLTLISASFITATLVRNRTAVVEGYGVNPRIVSATLLGAVKRGLSRVFTPFQRKLGDVGERLAVKLVAWAFDSTAVQKAFLRNVDCSTPIGRALNAQVEDCISNELRRFDKDDLEVDASNVSGLDRAIEDGINEFFAHESINANDIENLDHVVMEIFAQADADDLGLADAISDILDEKAKGLDDNLVRLIAQRMSY